MNTHIKNAVSKGPLSTKIKNTQLRNNKLNIYDSVESIMNNQSDDSKIQPESNFLTTETYFNTTRSHFNNTQENFADSSKLRKTLKSSQNFRKTFQYDRSQEQDINPLLNMYKMNDSDYNKSNRSKDYYQDSGSNLEELARKYNINNRLGGEEKEFIEKVIKVSGLVKSEEERDRESKGYCKIRNEYYPSPYSSFQALKLNTLTSYFAKLRAHLILSSQILIAYNWRRYQRK